MRIFIGTLIIPITLTLFIFLLLDLNIKNPVIIFLFIASCTSFFLAPGMFFLFLGCFTMLGILDGNPFYINDFTDQDKLNYFTSYFFMLLISVLLFIITLKIKNFMLKNYFKGNDNNFYLELEWKDVQFAPILCFAGFNFFTLGYPFFIWIYCGISIFI